MNDPGTEQEAKAPVPRSRWTLKGTLCLLGFFLFLLYMVIPCALWSPLYTQMVVVPSKADEKQYAFAMANSRHQPEDVYFQNEKGDKLHGWFYKNPQAKKLVLIHHGNAGNISTRFQLPDFLVECGASVFIYDYRGYGRSTGTPDIGALLKDGDAANKFVTEQLHYQPGQIVHYGESIGSGVACEVASKVPSGGLVFHSGLTCLPSVGRSVFFFLRPYPDFLFPLPQMRNIDKIASVHAPVLFIAAIPDNIVSYHEGEALFAKANQPKELLLLKESGHNCTVGADCAKVDQAMRKFLSI